MVVFLHEGGKPNLFLTLNTPYMCIAADEVAYRDHNSTPPPP